MKFNPIREDTGSLNSQTIVWTTETIKIAREAINKGKRLIATPFFENDTRKLRANLVYQRTKEEEEEWKRCANDIIYFSNRYVCLLTPEGIQHIELRDYQEDYLRHLQANRLSIMLAPRQCGKTISSAIELLWYILFSTDKLAGILGNKRRTAVEILKKTKDIFLELPYFLQPGIEKWNESEVLFDSGSRIICDATTQSPNLGDTIHYLLLDEFAHVPPGIAEVFYNQLFPTISAAHAKLRITSTQNGHNLFYKLWKGAVEQENEYKPFKVDWQDVPEWDPDRRIWVKRDEKWYRSQVANLGGEEEFNKQFGTNFVSKSNCLVSRIRLQRLQENTEVFIEKDLPGVLLNSSWQWLPSFDPRDLRESVIVITCDLAEQLGMDYTVYSVYRLSEVDRLTCVGFFRDNVSTRENCARSLVDLVSKYCNLDTLLVSHERNTYGDLWIKDIQTLSSEEAGWDNECLVKYYNESGTNYKHGVKITSGNKVPHCRLLKEELELGKVENNSHLFMLELENFCEQKNGTYKAEYGHDDLVMCAVQLMFVKSTLQYKMLKESVGLTGVELYNPYEGLGGDSMFVPAEEFQEDYLYRGRLR